MRVTMIKKVRYKCEVYVKDGQYDIPDELATDWLNAGYLSLIDKSLEIVHPLIRRKRPLKGGVN